MHLLYVIYFKITFLKHFSLPLHVSIAYRLSSLGSTYVLPNDDKRYAIETCRSSEKCFKKSDLK